MNRQDIATALSATGPLSSRLHTLNKNPEAADQFWTEVERLATERRDDLINITAGHRITVLTGIVHQAFDGLPAVRHASVAGYLWHLLDANARVTFKVTCKNPKSPQGQANMAAFVDYLERNGAVNYDEECRGRTPVSKADASRMMMDWLLSR